MPSIQSFTMTCEEVNDYGTFSEGDTVRGKLTLALLKETAVDSFFVKLKGDANVRWSEKSGDKTRTYSARRRYFKLKHSIVDEESPNKVIHQGTHVYEFCFTIPTGSLPSTYRGSHGKIIYMVEAKLSRSWKMTRTLERELKLVSKAIPYQQSLMSQQFGSTDKEMGFFSKGKVHMDVTVDRQGYAPGDTVAVVAKINNASSRDMAPKFSLVQNVSYRAEGHSKHERNIIYKQIDELMRPNTDKTAVCAVKIPHDVVPTILNCEILSLEYYVKVYLDISFASDPEVLFPVIICHPELISNRHSGGPGGPYSSSNFGGPIKSNFPSSALATGQPPAGAFGGSPNHVMYGPTPANGTQPNGYYGAHSYSPSRYSAQNAYQPNPAQRLPRYGDPYTAPSSTLHPPPSVSGYVPPPSAPEISTIPPSIPSAPLYNFQPSAPLMDANFLSQTDEPPPSYSLLFPDFATDKSNAN